MNEVREFVSTVMRRLEFAGSAEGWHSKLLDGEVHERICDRFGGRVESRSAAE